MRLMSLRFFTSFKSLRFSVATLFALLFLKVEKMEKVEVIKLIGIFIFSAYNTQTKMNVSKLTNIINQSFQCVMRMSSVYNIDESHAVKHSMNVYHTANEIYQTELHKNKFLENQQTIIFASAILHDMCDRKYIEQESGLRVIYSYMNKHLTDDEFEIISKIITSMSYSKVKKNGYADLGEYQLAYHIVREADLLTAYDIDRCIMFGMNIDKLPYSLAMNRAITLFKDRVLTYRDDNLFITDYSKEKSAALHRNAVINLSLLNLLDGVPAK